jgi:fatty acid CoA ligase FadD28
MMSHENILANFEQLTAVYFAEYGKVTPPDTTIVSWLPFYHDMGLFWEFAGRF